MIDESDVWVNSVDARRWNHLHFACRGGLLEDVLYLLERGISVNGAAENGVCPLHLACQRGASIEPVVRLLIEWGANVNAREIGHPYATPLYHASGAVRALLRSYGAK